MVATDIQRVRAWTILSGVALMFVIEPLTTLKLQNTLPNPDAAQAWSTALLPTLLYCTAIGLLLRAMPWLRGQGPARWLALFVIAATAADVLATAWWSSGYQDEGNRIFVKLVAAGISPAVAITWLQANTFVSTAASVACIGAWAWGTADHRNAPMVLSLVLFFSLFISLADAWFHLQFALQWATGDRGQFAHAIGRALGLELRSKHVIDVVGWTLAWAIVIPLFLSWKRRRDHQGADLTGAKTGENLA